MLDPHPHVNDVKYATLGKIIPLPISRHGPKACRQIGPVIRNVDESYRDLIW